MLRKPGELLGCPTLTQTTTQQTRSGELGHRGDGRYAGSIECSPRFPQDNPIMASQVRQELATNSYTHPVNHEEQDRGCRSQGGNSLFQDSLDGQDLLDR